MAKKFTLTGVHTSPIFTKEGEIFREEGDEYKLLPLDQISARENQPRKNFSEVELNELANSIKENGILQPIVVRKGEGGYKIIAGERRYRAAKKAGLLKIPAMIRNVTESEVAIFALIENIQREDLTPIEEAEAYESLIEEYGLTHEQVAKQVGKSRSSISNSLRLLSLEDEVIEGLKNKTIDMGHAKVLAGLSKEEQGRAVQKIIENKMSVRETEGLVKNIKNVDNTYFIERSQLLDMQSKFEPYTSKVKLAEIGEGRVRLTLDFNSIDGIKKLLEKLVDRN